MKKELGDCTKRLSLCFLFSSSAGGLSRSISFGRTCKANEKAAKPLDIRFSGKEVKENREKYRSPALSTEDDEVANHFDGEWIQLRSQTPQKSPVQDESRRRWGCRARAADRARGESVKFKAPDWKLATVGYEEVGDLHRSFRTIQGKH